MPTDERSSTRDALVAYLEALERANTAWLAGDQRAAARDAVLAAATLCGDLGAGDLQPPLIGLASALQDLDHGRAVELLKPAKIGTSRLTEGERFVRAFALDTLNGLLKLGGTIEEGVRTVAEAMAQAGYRRPHDKPFTADTVRQWHERCPAPLEGYEPIWGGRLREDEERRAGFAFTADELLDRLRRVVAED